MALGTITIVSKVALPKGGMLLDCSFAGESSYPTGGTTAVNLAAALKTALVAEVAAATDKNVRGFETLSVVGLIPGDCGQYVPSIVDGKLKVRDGGSGTWAEVSGSANISTTTFHVQFVCK